MSATPGVSTDQRPPNESKESAVNARVDREPPANSTQPGKSIDKWVFWPAASIILVFALFAILFPETATDMFSSIQSSVIKWFGWYYVAAIAVFVAFALWIGLSRYGDIKLGQDEDEPEFSVMSWFALLFAAGMGIGLVFLASPNP